MTIEEPDGIVRIGYRFAAIPEWVLYSPDLNGSDVRLYGVIARYGGRAYPKVGTLAERFDVSERTIFRSLQRLVAAGALRIEARFQNRRQVSSVYHLAGDHPWPVDNDEVGPDKSVTPRGDTDVIQNESHLNDVNPPNPPQAGDVSLFDAPEAAVAPPRRRPRTDRSPLRPDERPDDFAAWWDEYPRKVGKIAAEQAWRQMLDRLPDLEQLVAASVELGRRTAREHPEATEWVRFVPHPSTWLRRGDYLDLAGSPERPPVRNPCALCGIPDPCQEKCMGVAYGRLGSTDECIWADVK